MTLPLKQLQTALYSKLSGDSVLMDMLTGLFDSVPERTDLPYAVIGNGTQRDIVTDGPNVLQCELTIHVWTLAQGRKTALAIMERLYALLHNGTLTVSGYDLLLMRCDTASTKLADGDTRLLGELGVALMIAESA